MQCIHTHPFRARTHVGHFFISRNVLAVGSIALFVVATLGSRVAFAQDDTNWSTAFDAAGLNNTVHALAVDAGGNLYAGGDFTAAGSESLNHIAMWDGTNWTALGSGINGAVYALAVDASNNVYAGGTFTDAGGVTVSNIARWDGVSWSTLDAGLNGTVNALAVDASGNVYAGGAFTLAGSTTMNHVAKWDGSAWSALGSGTDESVLALALDASGNLYAGGSFTSSGGVSGTNKIAMWDGASWNALGTGSNFSIRAVAAVDGKVYAGGDFGTINGILAKKIAQWDGATWSALSTTGINTVYALATRGDGTLYMGGAFVQVDGQALNFIAAWNGTSWSALGSGTNNTVRALAASNDALYVGGEFTTAGGQNSSHIARWALAPLSSPPVSVPITPVPSTGTISPGDTFTVSIEVGSETESATDLFGVGFALHFDPTVLRADTVVIGSFLDGDIIFDETIDNISGVVTVSVTRKRGASGVTGYGEVVQIDFVTDAGASSQTANFTLSDELAVDPNGDTIPLTIQPGQVDINAIAVWPGDTDNNGDVDISDVLPVGSHFGLSGPSRTGGDFTWQAQPAEAWTPSAAMYADATGDGLVSQNDILPIGVNFGLSHSAGASLRAAAFRTIQDPLSRLRIPALSTGQRFTASLALGAPDQPITNVLGLAAEFSLPPSLKVLDSRSGTLLENGDLITLSRTDGNRYYVAYTRKRTAGSVSGSGTVLQLSVEVIAPMEHAADITLDALSLGTPDGTINAGPDTPLVLTSPLAIPSQEEAPTAFTLHGSYPNPFSSRATLAFDLPEMARVTVFVYDVLGREVKRIDAGTIEAGANQRVKVDAAGLASGSYLYRLRAEMTHGTETRTGRFVVTR